MFAKKEEGKIYQVKAVLHTMVTNRPVFILKTDEGDVVLDGRLYREIDRQLKAGQMLNCIGKPVKFHKEYYFDSCGFKKCYWEMEIVKPEDLDECPF